MRRTDREVTEFSEIEEIIRECRVCRLAFSAGMYPYIVPMNFGYACENGERVFYFHCAGEGRKLDLMQQNPNVAFELDCRYRLMRPENPADACGYSACYASVIGSGRASLVVDPEEKERGLLLLMQQAAGKREDYVITKNSLRAVTVFRVDVKSLSCKKHGSF